MFKIEIMSLLMPGIMFRSDLAKDRDFEIPGKIFFRGDLD